MQRALGFSPLKGYQGEELYAMSWICTMCQLLEGYEGFSLDKVESGTDQVVLYEFTAEDWYRAYCCLKY